MTADGLAEVRSVTGLGLGRMRPTPGTDFVDRVEQDQVLHVRVLFEHRSGERHAPVRFLRGSGLVRRAQTLQHYALYTGDPDGLAADLARYRAVTAATVAAAVARWLVQPIEVTTIPRSAVPALASDPS